MSEQMGTTNTVPTATAPRLADTDQVQPTPGPWYASRKHSFVMTKNYVVIAEIRGRPEQEANALLIAEAPNMLAALKRLVVIYRTDGHAQPCDCPACMGKVIISKIEGRKS